MLKNIFASIDIGSSNIKVVVCELLNNKLNLLAASSVSSKGIKRGMIVEATLAKAAIEKAFDEIESMLGIKVKKVIATVPSYFADFSFIKGSTSIINENHLVGSDEIVDVLSVAMDTKLTPNQEMVTIIPIDFKLDDGENLTNPLGHTGHNLGVRAIMVTVPKKNIYSVVSILEDIGVEVIDITTSGIGNIQALKDKEINNMVGAIVDIGSETTTVSLYNKSVIVKNSIIGVGGKVLDNDIAFTYKVSKDNAKLLKENFAVAYKKYASVNDYYELRNELNEDIRINQYEISELVNTRFDEIFDLVNKEINSLSSRELDYIMFTGGTSNIACLSYLINEKFGKNATVGNIKTVGVRNNIYSAALGNIIYFIGKLRLKGKDYTMISSKDSEDLSSIKKNNAGISSDSMLGKVVGYFFGE